MSFFSSLLKIIFITASVFPLYSETFIASLRRIRKKPDCNINKERLHICTREMDPVCATNKKTYSNPCVFCSAMIERKRSFRFKHYGECY